MKKLFSYLNIATLLIALSAMFVSCADNDDNDSGNLGLNIKVFSPTVVVPGTPMTINGSGLAGVTEIVFPGEITVSDFEVVTDEMIRVKAPMGLKEAGNLLVRNAAGETAVSRLPLTIGQTAILGYSAQEGDLLKGNETLTVYGKDMQFVTGAEFVDEDGNPIFIPASEFVRVANGRVVIQVPAKVVKGNAKVKIYIGDQIVESPEFKFETAVSGGHWETTKRFLWKNEEPATNGAVSWNGLYRFANTNTKTGEEIFAFSLEDWSLIKDGVVYFLFDGGDNANVRITTGWWTGAYMGGEHNCIDIAEVDEETGMKFIELNIKEDGNLYGNLDAQHLLFTGEGYTPMGIYVLDKVWIEGEEGHLEKVRTSFWKNGEQSTIPAPSWSGEGRFSRVSSATGEETYAFPDDVWEILKSEPFRIAIEKTSDNPNIRVTTGWWASDYGGKEYNCAELIEDVDGTLFIELNLSMYPDMLALLDAQHLLFTGEGYRLLEIYQEKDVFVSGGAEDGPAPIVIWENDGSHGAVAWDGVYRFSNVNTSSGEEILAVSMEDWAVIKDGTIYVLIDGDASSNVRITTGWWDGAYGGNEHNCIDMAEDDPATGMKVIKINIKEDGNLYDNLDAHHFLLTGEKYTPMKIYYYK